MRKYYRRREKGEGVNRLWFSSTSTKAKLYDFQFHVRTKALSWIERLEKGSVKVCKRFNGAFKRPLLNRLEFIFTTKRAQLTLFREIRDRRADKVFFIKISKLTLAFIIPTIIEILNSQRSISHVRIFWTFVI